MIMCDETTLFVAEQNSCNVVVQRQAKLHRNLRGALRVRYGNSLRCACKGLVFPSGLQPFSVLSRTRRTEGGEIHVRITIDSFANPGESILVPFYALCEVERDRMQKLCQSTMAFCKNPFLRIVVFADCRMT